MMTIYNENSAFQSRRFLVCVTGKVIDGKFIYRGAIFLLDGIEEKEQWRVY